MARFVIKKKKVITAAPPGADNPTVPEPFTFPDPRLPFQQPGGEQTSTRYTYYRIDVIERNTGRSLGVERVAHREGAWDEVKVQRERHPKAHGRVTRVVEDILFRW
jgi:hypothetical protein